MTSNSYTPFGDEGCSVVSSHVTGDLMFYTDGSKVIDKNHTLMPNGNGLFGHTSSFSNGKTCVNPSDCKQYYVFSMNYVTEQGGTGDLYYSIVDMSLNGNGNVANPSGDVLLKNVLITTGTSESMEVIPKSGSHDYWLLLAKNTTNTVEVYSVTGAGISLSSVYNLSNSMTDMRSLKYCKENGKVAITSMVESDPVLLLSFNDILGQIQAENIVPGTPWGNSSNYWQGTFDSEWSPDGTKLYISKYRWGGSSSGRLYQYDLNMTGNQPLLIHSLSNSNSAVTKGLKLAPDGKIYMQYIHSAMELTSFINVIEQPDLVGLNCNFILNQINMGSNISTTHLFPYFGSLANTLPIIPDTIFYSSGSDVLFPLQGYLDNEGDALNISTVNYSGGTVVLLGDSIQFVAVMSSCTNGQITVSYCDDYCVSLCDTFVIDIIRVK